MVKDLKEKICIPRVSSLSSVSALSQHVVLHPSLQNNGLGPNGFRPKGLGPSGFRPNGSTLTAVFVVQTGEHGSQPTLFIELPGLSCRLCNLWGVHTGIVVSAVQTGCRHGCFYVPLWGMPWSAPSVYPPMLQWLTANHGLTANHAQRVTGGCM